jgi:hypothetical protein
LLKIRNKVIILTRTVKPLSSPYSFQGLGEAGLKILSKVKTDMTPLEKIRAVTDEYPCTPRLFHKNILKKNNFEGNTMTAIIIFLVLIGLPVVFAIFIYNKFIRLRNMVEEGWSGIEVQLKRRANLIPNLLETVKGYMGVTSVSC